MTSTPMENQTDRTSEDRQRTARPFSRLAHDVTRDWKRWSGSERAAASLVAMLISAGIPAMYVMLALRSAR